MQMKWKSLLSLKAPVLLVFLVIWNGGFLTAMYVGGGGLAGMLSSTGMTITGVLCVAASLFGLSVAISRPFQQLVIAESRAKNFSVKEFYLLAIVAGVLALSRFLFPTLESTSNAF